MIHRFCVAWNFLTAIPFPFFGKESIRPEEMGRALTAFPWVGLALGSVLAAAYRILGAALPPAMASLSVLFLLVLLTGGLHLDGLADTIDGLQGASREDALRIMREGPIGAFGALGLIFVIGFKIVGLSSLPVDSAVRALWMMLVIGRWTFVTLLVHFPYPRSEGGLGTPFVLHSSKSDWVWATLFTILIVFSIASFGGLAAAGTALLLAWLAGRYLALRLGGLTGDTIGAIGEIIEAISLVQWNIYQHYWGR